MPVTEINNLEDPRLDPYRNLRTAKEARRSDTFIAEGTTLVERVLQSEFDVVEVLATTEKLRNFQQRIPTDTDVLQMDREQASKLVGYSFHTGVMCLARRKPSPPLAEVIPNAGPAFVLYADQVIDQQNLGLIIRIATGYGASAVVLGKGCADPFSRRVLRVSMGHGLFLPVLEGCGDAASELRSARFEFCATVLSEDAVPVDDFRYPERTVIVVGNETHGVSDEVGQQCHHRLTIPMMNGADSLNVAIATGIFCHTFRQQHRPQK